MLAAIALAVGAFIGAVGVGGVLLIPFLVLVGGLGIHVATSTALFSFLFTGLLGTYLFQRRGSIAWRLAWPVCTGALPFGYLGTRTASLFDPQQLTLLIAAIVVFAGIHVFRPGTVAIPAGPVAARGTTLTLLAVGAASGFGAGLSGAGGPLFSVPLMVILGFAPLAAVGVGQVLQILASGSGSLAALGEDRIDFAIAAWVTLFELAGVVAGVALAHRVGAATLRRLAGGLCVLVGAFMLLRSL